MPRSRICFMLMLAATALGCRAHGPFVKRESEVRCPTDVRKTVPWCYGEDAIFMCPCGPAQAYHGLKPTCWRPWPGTAAEWRDSHCYGGHCPDGGCYAAPVPGDSVGSPTPIVQPSDADPLEQSWAPQEDQPEPADIELLPPTSQPDMPSQHAD